MGVGGAEGGRNEDRERVTGWGWTLERGFLSWGRPVSGHLRTRSWRSAGTFKFCVLMSMEIHLHSHKHHLDCLAEQPGTQQGPEISDHVRV